MQTIKHYSRRSVFAICLLLVSYYLLASGEELNDILQLPTAPPGVVFEIASGDKEQLRWAIPAVQQHIQRLRERFPNLSIAVVTHGKEQFSLTRDNQKKYNEVHQGIQSLVKDSNIPVHVCGTYAERYNIGDNEFPDYIDVAAAGPAQINDYRELGYLLVKIKRP